jgi:hypothetical protein
MGTVGLLDPTSAASFDCKLWDGTTVIASGTIKTQAAGEFTSMALSGYLATPADNIRISCKDVTTTGGGIVAASADSTVKASTVSAIRIQ